jgi:hypothetical protein
MFPHSPLRTGHATFTAPGSLGIDLLPLALPLDLSSHFGSQPPPHGLCLTSQAKWPLMSTLEMSIPWPPSPCRRLSRPPTTMEPPTPLAFIGWLLASRQWPPAFTETDSTRPCRQRFAANQSCSSQYPEREQGKLSNLLQPVHYRAAWEEGAIHPGSFAAPHHPRSRLRR